MKVFSKVGIVSLVVAAAVAIGGSAFAKGKGGKSHSVKGTITAFTNSSITVETKKKGPKDVQLTSSTVYEIKGKKGQPNTTAAYGDLVQGAKVRITTSNGQATEVLISKKHHKRK